MQGMNLTGTMQQTTLVSWDQSSTSLFGGLGSYPTAATTPVSSAETPRKKVHVYSPKTRCKYNPN